MGFIVRGVDEMLRTEFDLPLGLADTTTWAELAARNDKITIPDHIKPDEPFVQILDPATGTGTFLVEVIDLIHRRMVDTWKAGGKSAAEIKAAWNAYVPAHLLPRITAFELKMAAYAIAHMKVGLKLVETGYTFGSDERLLVLLTNTLQPARELDLVEEAQQLALAHEAKRANEAKTETPFTVVIGNPPYKGESMNPSKVKGKLTFAGEIIQRFFQVRGEPLGEKNPKWLNNDYVKFIAFAMRQIERSGTGVLGYITSNSWLDGPTFRGVRTGVMDCFPQLRIVDLHGNVSRAEVAEDGTADEGVFAISEGTAIHIASKLPIPSVVKTHDLIGRFDESANGKIPWLENQSVRQGIKVELVPSPPFYLLVPSTEENKAEFYTLSSIRSILPINSVGFATANDRLIIQFSANEMLEIGGRLLAADFEDIESEREGKPKPDEWRVQFDVVSGKMLLRKKSEARDWRVSWARTDLDRHIATGGKPVKVKYRPFDDRWSYFTQTTKGFMCMPRGEVMSHLIDDDDSAIALLTSRMTKGEEFGHVHISTHPAEVICGTCCTAHGKAGYFRC